MKKITYARCHFTDDYVKVMIYLGNGYYAVRYPDNTTQEAHESTLDFDGAMNGTSV
mgnify:FL=1|jgi:hypothetical protein